MSDEKQWMHPKEAVERFTDPKAREQYETALRDLDEAENYALRLAEERKALLEVRKDMDHPPGYAKRVGHDLVAQSNIEDAGEEVLRCQRWMVSSVVEKLASGKLIARGTLRDGPVMEIPQGNWKDLLLDVEYSSTRPDDEFGLLGDGDYFYHHVEIRQP